MSEFVNVPATIPGDYAIRMRGDAMAPGILDSDLLVVRKLDQGEQAEAGAVVIAKVNGEATARRYRPDDPEKGRMRLAADNPTIEDINAATADVVVMGLVTGLVRCL